MYALYAAQQTALKTDITEKGWLALKGIFNTNQLYHAYKVQFNNKQCNTIKIPKIVKTCLINLVFIKIIYLTQHSASRTKKGKN